MTHDDPCDELSDGLVEILLLNVRLDRITPEQRRIAAYGTYGKYKPLPYADYARLVKPSIERALRKLELNSTSTSETRFYVADQAAAVTECGTEHLRDLISNPAIVIQPKPRAYSIKHDNPISPRTWTLD